AGFYTGKRFFVYLHAAVGGGTTGGELVCGRIPIPERNPAAGPELAANAALFCGDLVYDVACPHSYHLCGAGERLLFGLAWLCGCGGIVWHCLAHRLYLGPTDRPWQDDVFPEPL